MIRSEPNYVALNDELDQLDDDIEAMQTAKREVLASLREEHGKLTADAFKAARKIRRMDSEKRAHAEQVGEEAFRILGILNAPRATRVEKIDKFAAKDDVGNTDAIPEHDPETGELTPPVGENEHQPATNKGESDAKSADAVCEDDLIDRRRPQSLVPTEAEHQPSPDDETHDAPTESAADEISEPIPPSAVSPPQPTAPEQAVPLPVSSGAQIQSSEAGVATGAEAGAAKAETMAGPASAPFTPLAFLLKDHAPAKSEVFGNSEPLNPNCQKPATCKWARSMASCSACANAAAAKRKLVTA